MDIKTFDNLVSKAYKDIQNIESYEVEMNFNLFCSTLFQTGIMGEGIVHKLIDSSTNPEKAKEVFDRIIGEMSDESFQKEDKRLRAFLSPGTKVLLKFEEGKDYVLLSYGEAGFGSDVREYVITRKINRYGDYEVKGLKKEHGEYPEGFIVHEQIEKILE